MFAGAPLLLGFAFMVGVVLTVVFPTGREFAELTGRQRVDEYSIAYLTVLTRAHPEDVHLQIVYVRQLAALGRWDAALAALAVARPDPSTLAEVRSLRMDLMLARARELPSHEPAAAAAFAAVHDELRSTSEILMPPGRGRELAKLALELEDPALAARFFLNVSDTEADPSARAEALADAGRWLRAAGDGRRASECFSRAAVLTRDRDRKSTFVVKGAEALEADGRPCEAAALLKPHASASTDLVLVERAAALSTSCGAAHDAKALGRRILELAPDDERRLRAQVRRELAAGDPLGALVLLRRLVHRHPYDGDLRRTTARVAEWAGRPDVALEQWLSLVAFGRPSTRSMKP